MLGKDFFEDGGGAHVGGEIAAVLGGAERRQGKESGAVHVARKFAVNLSEGGFVTAVAFFFRAVAKEDFDAVEIEFFALGRGHCETRFGRGSEPVENLARSSNVFLVPHGMILRHGLAPVSHRKIGSGFLSGAEMLGGIVVFEVVKLSQCADKIRLNGGWTGICERNFAEILLGKCRGRTQKE